MKPVTTVLIAVCCLAAVPALAVEVPKTYPEAMRWYERAAAEGSANAQFLLGRMYETGQYRAKDPTAAVRWYRKAANQGHQLARYRLGQMHRDGIGVARDAKAAARWFEMAAEQGMREAQFNLGFLYERGEGVERSGRLAASWYRKAAMQGLGAAQYNLGILLAGMTEGGAQPVDLVEAWAWLSLAWDNGVTAAARAREDVEKRLAPADRDRARERAKALEAAQH